MITKQQNQLKEAAMSLSDIPTSTLRKVAYRTKRSINTFEDFFTVLFGESLHSSQSGNHYLRIANTDYRIFTHDMLNLLDGAYVEVKKRDHNGYYHEVGLKRLVELLPISLDA